MSAHLDRESSLFVVALAADDPERIAALAHADQCAQCRALLADGDALLALLDSEPAPVVDERLAARVRDAVFAAGAPAQGVALPRATDRWSKLLLALVGLASLLFVVLDARGAQVLHAALGLECLAVEIAGALVPLTLAGALSLRGTIAPTALRMATVAAGGALLAQLWLRLRCPAHEAGLHLVSFHLVGVLLAALLGYLAAARIDAWRQPARP